MRPPIGGPHFKRVTNFCSRILCLPPREVGVPPALKPASRCPALLQTTLTKRTHPWKTTNLAELRSIAGPPPSLAAAITKMPSTQQPNCQRSSPGTWRAGGVSLPLFHHLHGACWAGSKNETSTRLIAVWSRSPDRDNDNIRISFVLRTQPATSYLGWPCCDMVSRPCHTDPVNSEASGWI